VRLILLLLCILLMAVLIMLSFQCTHVLFLKKLEDLQQVHNALNENLTGKTLKRNNACISDGGHLVIINSRDEQFLIKTEESFWIGLTDEKIEDQWLWVDNTNLCKDKGISSFTEPDNWKGFGGEYPSGEDCAHIHKNSIQDLKSWFDAVCNKALRRICETRSSRQT
uniref:Immune-related, lectin-like receptor 4 n=1 Tax=Sinocyclocheilus anshuiensis TaxID=1608454 RepID=A0A671RJY6_9TELE